MFSTQSDNCIPTCPYFDITSLFATESEDPKLAYEVNGLIKTGRVVALAHDTSSIRDRLFRQVILSFVHDSKKRVTSRGNCTSLIKHLTRCDLDLETCTLAHVTFLIILNLIRKVGERERER